MGIWYSTSKMNGNVSGKLGLNSKLYGTRYGTISDEMWE